MEQGLAYPVSTGNQMRKGGGQLEMYRHMLPRYSANTVLFHAQCIGGAQGRTLDKDREGILVAVMNNL